MDSRINRFDEDLFPAGERQRARGEIRASFAHAGARTEAARLFETGGLRLRFPRAGAECEAVVVNTGGGMAGGDRARIDFALAPGANDASGIAIDGVDDQGVGSIIKRVVRRDGADHAQQRRRLC